MTYDPNNIFAKILRGEIPCQKTYEDEFALAFNDIHPQAPIHILVIPKGAYTTCDDFTSRANDQEIAGFYRALGKVIGAANLAATGYRLIANAGIDGHQEVPHFHIHILGGGDLGTMRGK